ncbi:LCP family protein [Salibacterium halotolerans]|uniref:Cell envelope-related function transcriptional attenuator common domain-containing protein n=1 Tax=Salibacterium halotolerans TaxID=1884432 RepID=A0A1I5WY13_9BACI|nr:LCP family protein [Salibacterium halotolerans]SFQ24407.1 cell envelope-related function transcriptional attenuator common domain-containing protein [Salibacterium halotolerans]
MADKDQNTRVGRRKRKKRPVLKTFMILGLISFVLVGAMVGYFAWKFTTVAADTQDELERGGKSEKREVAVDPNQDNVSVLFMGVDDRDGELQGRTDAMILATFNREQGSVKMTSIPRDSLVDIPGHGEDKITHANAYGGTDLAVKTVENMLNLPVDYYVKLNFQAFIEIINALNGVKVDVPFAFTEQDSEGNDGAISLDEGTQMLNGEEALAFARMRKQDPRGDIGRGDRQEQIISALIKRSASIGSIHNYDDVMESVKDHMKMNFTVSDLVSFHKYAGSVNDIERLQLKGSDVRYDGVYYYQLLPDVTEQVSQELRNHLELDEQSSGESEQNQNASSSEAQTEAESP